jgi:hypothetical protein
MMRSRSVSRQMMQQCMELNGVRIVKLRKRCLEDHSNILIMSIVIERENNAFQQECRAILLGR